MVENRRLARSRRSCEDVAPRPRCAEADRGFKRACPRRAWPAGGPSEPRPRGGRAARPPSGRPHRLEADALPRHPDAEHRLSARRGARTRVPSTMPPRRPAGASPTATSDVLAFWRGGGDGGGRAVRALARGVGGRARRAARRRRRTTSAGSTTGGCCRTSDSRATTRGCRPIQRGRRRTTTATSTRLLRTGLRGTTKRRAAAAERVAPTTALLQATNGSSRLSLEIP